MSFITYDYQCKECGVIEERMVRRSEVNKQTCECRPQGSVMNQLPPGPITTFKQGDRSAQKGRKPVSLRDPHGGASSKGHSASLD